MDVIGAQVVLGRDRRIDQVDVTLDRGVTADDACRDRRDPARRPRGAAAGARGEQIERYLRSYRTLLSGISALALLAASFVVGCTITTAIAARRRELGSLRCVGGRRRRCRRSSSAKRSSRARRHRARHPGRARARARAPRHARPRARRSSSHADVLARLDVTP
jgi:hypothetical protein